jgi:hypothetical protein
MSDTRSWKMSIDTQVVELAVIVILVAFHFTTLNKLANGTTEPQISSRQSQAETRFILCSRDTNVVDPRKAHDVEKVCEGYSTLAQSYKTKGVPTPS